MLLTMRRSPACRGSENWGSWSPPRSMVVSWARWAWATLAVVSILSSCGSSSSSLSQLKKITWSKVAYPMSQCEPPGSSANPGVPVQPVVYATPAHGVSVAVVVVHCEIASHPPNAVFVYRRGRSSVQPQLVQQLVTERDYWLATAPPRANGAELTLAVDGYGPSDSGANPSIHTTLTWQWRGNGYQETSPEPSHQLSGP